LFSNAAQSIQPQTPLASVAKTVTDPLPHPIHTAPHLLFEGIQPPFDLPVNYEYNVTAKEKQITAFIGKQKIANVTSLAEVPYLLGELHKKLATGNISHSQSSA
jgi:hypothetical protein